MKPLKQKISITIDSDILEKIKEKALADYAVMYGKHMADAVVKESQQDFTKVEY